MPLDEIQHTTFEREERGEEEKEGRGDEEGQKDQKSLRGYIDHAVVHCAQQSRQLLVDTTGCPDPAGHNQQDHLHYSSAAWSLKEFKSTKRNTHHKVDI